MTTAHLIDLIVDERLDQSETLTLSIPSTSPKAELLELDATLEHGGRSFYVTDRVDARNAEQTITTVTANAEWYKLGDTIAAGTFILAGETTADGLAAILDGTDWTVDPRTTDDAAPHSIEADDRTHLDLLRSWAKISGKHLRFDSAKKYVALVDVAGRDLGVSFRYRRNVRSVVRRAQPPEVTTLYPYGADELTIAGVNGGKPFVENFSYYTDQGLTLAEARERFTRSRVWYSSTVSVDTDLLAAAEARLALLSAPAVSYELAVVDLSDLTGLGDDSRIDVGDTVRVHDPELGDNVRTTVVRLVTHPNSPERNEVELAYIIDPLGADGDAYRPDTTDQWSQYVGRVGTAYEVRNDGAYVVGRIPLRFRSTGRANYHVDIEATGVGAGTMLAEVIDATPDVAEPAIFRTVEVDYIDGQKVRAFLSWAREGLEGPTEYRVRVSTLGGSPTTGIDITPDRDDEASFYVMAQNAVRESPSAANSIRYDTELVHQFTVPDNVVEIDVEVVGAAGGGDGATPTSGAIYSGGRGARVTATLGVVPGSILDVVPGSTGGLGGGGWPNGGAGARITGAAKAGYGGGGSSSIGPQGMGTTLAGAYIVAGGGGGGGDYFITNIQPGGSGGIFNGGAGGSAFPGQGGTQTAGGAGGIAVAPNALNGDAGEFNKGGNAYGGFNAFTFPGGGGGGGWYGGGGAGSSMVNGAGTGGGGGGGSGYIAPAAVNASGADGGNLELGGFVVISWADPV